MSRTREPSAVVARLCEALGRRDVETVTECLHDDVSYHNVGSTPTEGRAAVIAALEHQLDLFAAAYRWDLVNVAVTGDMVLTERVDVVSRRSDEWVPLPVMGAFETRAGRIAAWRDYWDPRLLRRMLDGEDCRDRLPAHASAAGGEASSSVSAAQAREGAR